MWSARRKTTQDDGWSDFLGRDESDTTLSTRLEVVEIDTPSDPEAGGLERKSPISSPPPGEEADAVSLDLLAALDRGPSREYEEHKSGRS